MKWQNKFLFARFVKGDLAFDLAFEYVYQLKLYIRSDEFDVNEMIDLEFL